MANYFVAFVLNHCSDLLPTQAPGCVRLFQASDLHCTIAFLGRMDPQHVTIVGSMMDDIVSSTIRCRAQRLRLLPDTQHCRAISWDFGLGSDALQHIQGQWRDRFCDAVGAAREQRPPLAHCTIARPSSRITAEEREIIREWSHRLQPPDREFVIDSVALYTWAQDRSRNQFAILRQRSLQ